jgi:hypothetical protein
VESRVEVLPAERSTGHPGHQASAAFDNPMYGKTKVRNQVRPGSTEGRTALWSFSLYARGLCDLTAPTL